jgi:hypothetical protein
MTVPDEVGEAAVKVRKQDQQYGWPKMGIQGNNTQPRETMDINLELTATGKVLKVRVEGKLTKEAYLELAPAVDKLIEEHCSLRILFEMHQFHGWSAGAMWEDLKFDLAHWKDIERLAIVGDSKWEAGMAVFCKPFTKAKIQYFDIANLDDAQTWIESAL